MQPTWLALWNRPCCTSFSTTRFGLLLYALHHFLFYAVAEENIRAITIHTASYIQSAWSVHCALLSMHNIIYCMHRMQHSAEAFCGLTVSTLHCMVSSLQQHAILCQTMVSHIPCCVLRMMGIHRVQSSTWRLYDNRSATRGMFGSEKHYPVTIFLRELVRDALFRTGDKRMTTSSLLD